MKAKSVSLDGWVMTKGSFKNESLKVVIHRTYDYNSQPKSVWVCHQEGFKTVKFNTVFEAMLAVNKRSNKP